MNYRSSDDKTNEIYEPADGFMSSEIPHCVFLEITARFGSTLRWGAGTDFMRVK